MRTVRPNRVEDPALRRACPRCRAPPGKLCTTKDGTWTRVAHVGRVRGDPPRRRPRTEPIVDDQLITRYGLTWEKKQGGNLWAHLGGLPGHDSFRYWMITDMPFLGRPRCSLWCGGKDQHFETLDECFQLAALNVERRPLLTLLVARKRWRIAELERRFGHLL